MTHPAPGALSHLAELYGVQTSYWDAFGQQRSPSDATLQHLLQSLGAPLHGPDDVGAAIAHVQGAHWGRLAEPVIVAWRGEATRFDLRLEEARSGGTARVTFHGDPHRRFDVDLDAMPAAEAAEVGGVRYVRKRVPFAADLPVGRHRARIEAGGREADAWVFSAPTRFWTSSRSWGLFCPLYALCSERSWGVGDFSDLYEFRKWARGYGCDVVSVLPLLAAFLDEWFEPSPYRPVSRLHYNEVYIDVGALPDLHGDPAIAALIASDAFASEVRELRALPEVDFRRVMAIKRPLLQKLADRHFRDLSINEWADSEERKDIAQYAHFRAAVESTRKSFREWPWEMAKGKLPTELIQTPSYRYHAYVQQRAREQLSRVARSEGSHSPLYLDLPLGVHPDGYDAWKHRSAFLDGVEAGAPPDGFFSRGQKWGFAPLDPVVMRETGYDYFACCLRAQMSIAGMLRIDHVMGLHRLFCVPIGLDATEGTYVRYRPEEFYAVLAIESHRHQCMVVGEDLGTVPDEVRHTMERHAVQRMYVFQFDVGATIDHGVRIGEPFVASLNTHDTPPFAAFYEGDDIDQRLELGLLTAEEAEREKASRAHMRRGLKRRLLGEDSDDQENDLERILDVALTELSRSEARCVLVSLEDLWLETEAQNVPGTVDRPNWRRRARYTLEQMRRMTDLARHLGQLDESRRSPVS